MVSAMILYILLPVLSYYGERYVCSFSNFWKSEESTRRIEVCVAVTSYSLI